MSSASLSDRHDLRPQGPLVYDTAPDRLRYKTPMPQHWILCQAMRSTPDRSLWSDSALDWKVDNLIAVEPWYAVPTQFVNRA